MEQHQQPELVRLQQQVDLLSGRVEDLQAENRKLREEMLAPRLAGSSESDPLLQEAYALLDQLRAEKEELSEENSRLRRAVKEHLTPSLHHRSISSMAPNEVIPPSLGDEAPGSALASQDQLVGESSQHQAGAGAGAGSGAGPAAAAALSAASSSSSSAAAAGSRVRPPSTPPPPLVPAAGGTQAGRGSAAPVVPPRPGSGAAAASAVPETSGDHEVTVEFVEDSPFFRARLHATEGMTDALGERLKQVSRRAAEFCAAGSAFSQKCAAFSEELLQEWKDVPSAGARREVTLKEMTQRLGALLQHVSQILSHLMLNTDTLLVNAVDEFRGRHVKGARESAQVLQRACDDYETALSASLHVGPEKTPSRFSRKNREPDEAEARAQLANLRRHFETVRFDHVHRLNELHTERILDLVELVCASFFGFITFFHEGEYSATSARPDIEAANMRLNAMRTRYRQEALRDSEDRRELERGLGNPSFSVTRSFFAGRRRPGVPQPLTAELRGRPAQVTKQGYLYKQSTSLKRDWKRRWFVLRDGQLFYYRGEEDLEPQHVVNVIICSVRESREPGMTNCFELISPNKRTYVLQAESAELMREWIVVFRNCTESLLVGQGEEQSRLFVHRPSATEDERRKADDLAQMMLELRRQNPECADCGRPSPDWASINIGCVVCIECSGIHRSLGTHISKVRSVTLDAWDLPLLRFFRALGNARVNQLYEHVPHSEFPKPSPSTPREEKAVYIQSKYVAKLFMNKRAVDAKLSTDELGRALYEAASENELEAAWTLAAFGTDMNWANPDAEGATPLHAAAENDSGLVATFLLNSSADPNAKNGAGETPLAVARRCGSDAVIAILG